jgi:hypothetical protein
MDKITNRNEMFVKRLCNTIKHLSEVTILSTGFVCWLSGCSRAPTHTETDGDVSQVGAVSVYVSAVYAVDEAYWRSFWYEPQTSESQ